MADDIQAPSIGRIVHFALGNGEPRPAIVVRVHETKTDDSEPLLNLRVFLDGADAPYEDRDADKAVVRIMSSEPARLSPLEAVGDPPRRNVYRVCRPDGFAGGVSYDADGAPGTWRWPPRAPRPGALDLDAAVANGDSR